MSNEQWDEVTQYGRADLTLDPTVREAFKVACLIERCGASVELTTASSAAFALVEQIFDKLMQLAAHGIEQENLIAELRQQLGKTGEQK